MSVVRVLMGALCLAMLAGGCQSADPYWWPGGRFYGQEAYSHESYGPAPVFSNEIPPGALLETAPEPLGPPLNQGDQPSVLQ